MRTAIKISGVRADAEPLPPAFHVYAALQAFAHFKKLAVKLTPEEVETMERIGQMMEEQQNAKL